VKHKRVFRTHCDWRLLSMLPVLFALLAGRSSINADTHGYDFRPGPHAPKGFQPGPGADATGMDLSGSAFIGMDLSNANFEDCTLQRAVFVQVRFQHGSASFKGADLRYAMFIDTPDSPAEEWLDERAFTDALINGLQFVDQRAHLSLTQLRSTRSFKLKDLSECQIVGGVSESNNYSYFNLRRKPIAVDFRQFDLRNATFAAADFSKSDFTGAIITGATFFKSAISPAQIASTSRCISRCDVNPFRMLVSRPGHPNLRVPHQDLTRVFDGRILSFRSGYADLAFSYMDLSTWDFVNADLRGTRFCDVNLTGVDFTGANISEAHFWKSISKEQLLATQSYRMGDLVGIVLARLDLSNVDFSGQNLTRARFVECNLNGADFTDAIITDADFRGCFRPPPTVEQIESTWNYKHGRMEGIKLRDDVAEALKKEQE